MSMDAPTGLDLINTLSFAFPNVRYSLIGTEFDPHEAPDGTAPGLIWPDDVDTPRPTAQVLAQKWAEWQGLQAEQQAFERRDWAAFRDAFWELDDGKVVAIAKGSSNSSDWSLFLSLLGAPPKNVVVMLNTFLEVRRGLKQDLTPQQCDLITQAAAQCHIPLVISAALPAH